MAYPSPRTIPERTFYARTTSIGATPAAGSTVAHTRGKASRVFAFSEGASSGTITVAVAIAGTTQSALGFSFTGGANASGSVQVPAATEVQVSEGDVVTFTPSGGAGASIPGHFALVVR
jgi:hypothetical protein